MSKENQQQDAAPEQQDEQTQEAAPVEEAAATQEAAPAPLRKMRMLADGIDHKAGDVLEFDNEKAVELIHAGLAESAE